MTPENIIAISNIKGIGGAFLRRISHSLEMRCIV